MSTINNQQNKGIGSFWQEKITYSEEEIISWVEKIKNEDKLFSIFSSKIYTNLRSYYSSLRKLNESSRKLHNYYFRKIVLNNNQCTACNKDIELEFIMSFNYCPLNQLPKWCKHHYENKEWMNLHKEARYSEEANLKRSKKRKEFLKTDKGKEYCKNVGIHNKINTKKWQKLRTPEQKIISSLKASQSQISNILNGSFDPQKNYKHYHKNECFINNKRYIFRSSWEVIFFISHPYLEYETYRIKYKKDNNKNGVYIPDFIDIKNKIIYELKPRRNFIKQQPKMNACIEWCLKKGYKFIWINEDNLVNYINVEDNKDPRNIKFYEKAFKGINGNIKNKINKENRK